MHVKKLICFHCGNGERNYNLNATASIRQIKALALIIFFLFVIFLEGRKQTLLNNYMQKENYCSYQSCSTFSEEASRQTVDKKFWMPIISASLLTVCKIYKKGVTTVFVDTRLWRTKHPWTRFQNFRQSCKLSTDRIEIHQSQPTSMT